MVARCYVENLHSRRECLRDLRRVIRVLRPRVLWKWAQKMPDAGPGPATSGVGLKAIAQNPELRDENPADDRGMSLSRLQMIPL